MKKTIFAVIMTIAILFGMSTVGNAQDDKNNALVKNEKKKSSSGKFMKALSGGKPSAKKVSGPTASIKTNQAKSEAAAKKTADSTAAADAQKQTNNKIADLEKQLSEKNVENTNLKAKADASKADADSLAKQLYVAKFVPKAEEAPKGIQSEAPVASNVIEEQNDPAPVSVKNPVYQKPQTTKVLRVMDKNGKWVEVTKTVVMPMPNKGEIKKFNKVATVRKSDLQSGKFDAEIEALKRLGYTLEEVSK